MRKNTGNVFVSDDLVIHFCNGLYRGIGKKQKSFPVYFIDDRIVAVGIIVIELFRDSAHLFLNSLVVKFIGGSIIKLFAILV